MIQTEFFTPWIPNFISINVIRVERSLKERFAARSPERLKKIDKMVSKIRRKNLTLENFFVVENISMEIELLSLTWWERILNSKSWSIFISHHYGEKHTKMSPSTCDELYFGWLFGVRNDKPWDIACQQEQIIYIS